MVLETNMKAPEFSLPDKNGTMHSLSDITTKNTLIFFYPKDSTPGCTIESVNMSKAKNDFEKLDCSIIGISGGDEKSKTKFCDKHNLTIPMLSDKDNEVGKTYGVFGEKKFMGKTYQGYSRVSFLLDKNKKIIQVYDKVKPPTHTKQVLSDLQ